MKIFTKDAILEALDPENIATVNRWLARGDGIAVYQNVALDSANLGHRQFLSFGSPAAQFEGEPPEKLPDFPTAINWAYTLEGTFRGEPLPLVEPLSVEEARAFWAKLPEIKETSHPQFVWGLLSLLRDVAEPPHSVTHTLAEPRRASFAARDFLDQTLGKTLFLVEYGRNHTRNRLRGIAARFTLTENGKTLLAARPAGFTFPEAKPKRKAKKA
jgi:hypothetical protein